MIKEKITQETIKLIETSRFGDTGVAKAAVVQLDREKREGADREAFLRTTSELQSGYFRRRVILISVIVIGLSWLSVVLTPNLTGKVVSAIGSVSSKAQILLLSPIFGATLFGSYAVTRIMYPTLEVEERDAGVMQSFHQHADSSKKSIVWVVVSGLAALNTLLFAATYLYLTDGYLYFR